MISDRVEIKTLPTQVVGKTIIIGDIHGCPNELDNLLVECNYQKEIDRVIHVGDLVNKGYDSRGVVQRMVEIGAYGVVGNHDDTLLECIRDLKYFNQRDMKDPVKRTAKKFPGHLTDYLKSLPHLLKIPQYNLIISHAGINPYLSLENQNPADLTNMRRVMADGKAVHKGCLDGVPWAKVWSGPETVVFGHDAKAGLQEEAFALGLDTGCCYGDRLTAVIYPGKRLVHVPGAKLLNIKTPKSILGDTETPPATPTYYDTPHSHSPCEGLMTPSMVRTNSRPTGTPQSTPGTKTAGGSGASPPPQWPSQPLPGLVIGGTGRSVSSQGERTPPTIAPPLTGTSILGLTTGGSDFAPPSRTSSSLGINGGAIGITTSGGGGGASSSSNSSSGEVSKLKKELVATQVAALQTIAQSKQVPLLLALLKVGGAFDEAWYDFMSEPTVPKTLWKDLLWCLAKGLSDPTTTEGDQERCLNLMQDILIDQEEVKDEVGFVLKTQLSNDHQTGLIKAEKAFKSTMIALR